MKAKLYILLIISGLLGPRTLLSQTVSDCLGAIPVCDSIYFEEIAYLDEGDFENELHPDCCVEEEINSVWYRFTVKEAGLLGFNIIPNDLEDDYDWSLFNLTGESCDAIQSNFSLITSCNATGGDDECVGITGANNETEYTFQNLNCNEEPPTLDSDGFRPGNAFIPVQPGEVYVLLIVNWEASENGYTLDFTVNDDVGIYDEERPNVELTPIYDGCEVSGVIVNFNEPMICESFDATDFTLTGPGGPYNINLESIDCEESQFGTSFTISFDPPIAEESEFILHLNEDPLDLCLNPVFENEVIFDVVPQSNTVSFLYDTTICGNTFTIDATEAWAQDYLWSNGEDNPTLEVTSSGLYSVSIDSECRTAEYSYQVTLAGYIDILSFETTPQFCETLGSINITEIDTDSPISFFQLNGTETSTTPNFSNLEAGEYSLVAYTVVGCTDTLLFTIGEEVSDLAIEATDEYLIVRGDSVQFDPVIIGSYTEQFYEENTTLSCTDCLFPFAKPNVTTSYFLIVRDENGCEVVKEIIVRVESEYQIYSPNVFTPNNDGVNDYFRIFGTSSLLEIIEFRIYSRWGELVHEGRNIEVNDNYRGWDGNFKGRSAGPGVFAWYAIVRYDDDSESVVRGNLTIIK